MEIYIDNRQEKIEVGEEIQSIIKRVVREVLVLENQSLDCEVSVSFVDNEEIRGLNRDFRGIDRETDVLSFPLDDEILVPGPLLLGDIIISLEKALDQARDYNHSLEREVAYLTAHSMLHLLGYDHEEEDEREKMRAREKETMKRLGIFKNIEGE